VFAVASYEISDPADFAEAEMILISGKLTVSAPDETIELTSVTRDRNTEALLKNLLMPSAQTSATAYWSVVRVLALP
tara:strand:- start:661 stop:891 length:231 start_codon:yes stop_codon:yes gene_type:complete